MRYLIGMIFLVISLTGYGATVYTTTDENQNITYSDSPAGDSQKMQVPNSNVTNSANVSSSPSMTGANTLTPEVQKPYTTLTVTSPQDQATFQNQHSIPIEIKIDPELQKDHFIQAYVDGVLHGKTVQTTKFELEQIERGTHQIYVAVIDANKNILRKSNTVTVYIHLASLVNKPQPGN